MQDVVVVVDCCCFCRYAPGVPSTKWEEFGIEATVQGKCCGPYRLTFGAKGGLGAQECGMYLYSEIQAISDAEYYYDKTTQTAIGYVWQNSSDGWTEGGTWFSYNDQNSVQAVAQFISEFNGSRVHRTLARLSDWGGKKS